MFEPLVYLYDMSGLNKDLFILSLCCGRDLSPVVLDIPGSCYLEQNQIKFWMPQNPQLIESKTFLV